ncbi:MAG: hypothetical protein HQK58_00300 [Deltaproteobacteria bacterium]|nr:hypothetical protein [Deltaproteobacteria bacterium]
MTKKKKKSAGKKKKSAKTRTSNAQGRTWAASGSEFDSLMELVGRPMMDHPDLPEGFQEVGLMEAMTEFGKPIMDLIDPNDRKGMKKLFEVATAIWTYTILIEDPDEDEDELDAGVLDPEPVIKIIKKQLKLDQNQATELFYMMLERKEYLFPSDIQPESGLALFLRNEGPSAITEFDYSRIEILDIPAAPPVPDANLASMMNQMDQYIYDQAEYDDWESDFFYMEKECTGIFSSWIEEIGLPEFYEEFAFYAQMFIEFVYQHEHPEVVVLKSVSPVNLEEFLFNYVLRKVMIEPDEYVNIPPALKLFYRFLYEKGYLDENQSNSIIKHIGDLEPGFIDALRKKFG